MSIIIVTLEIILMALENGWHLCAREEFSIVNHLRPQLLSLDNTVLCQMRNRLFYTGSIYYLGSNIKPRILT